MATKKTVGAPRRGRSARPKDQKDQGRRAEQREHGRAGGARGGSGKGDVTTAEVGGFQVTRVQREIGGRPLVLEVGRMAKQADGAVLARYGDTMVLATAQSQKGRDDIDFLPLTVDYREKAAAAGKFPGGFFKREGRPTSREILVSRIIDRALRPLFPEGFFMEVQVLAQVLCTDQENDSDILAAIASFAAVAVSSIPFDKKVGACRIALRNDKLVVNPTWTDLQAPDNRLNLTVAAHPGAIVMVEAGADEVPEEVMLEALELGQRVCTEVAEMIEDLVAAVGKPKLEWTPADRHEELRAAISKRFGKLLREAPFDGANKHEQSEAKAAALEDVKAAFPAPEGCDGKESAAHEKAVMAIARETIDAGIRAAVLDGKRVDGRGWTGIRPISIEVGVLPRCHGSALFTRGETQALCTATLGTRDDEQMLDGIYPEEPKRFLLHYNFPPFSVGEVRRFGFVGRREIGHGALAERAIERVLPAADQFPYSVRITSEILESNGSSSMATVCGATLALMDAGVPLRQPVAGIAMGLVLEGKKIAVLSDILGTEDHCGDMDFKVAGTGKGITALQMDIKCEGLTREILQQALGQAREGRLHILREMLRVIRSPRAELSPNAPRLESVKVPSDKIGLVIGPGGRMVRQLQEEFDTRIHISDDGTVQVAGTKSDRVLACVQRIRDMTAEVEVGAIYTGRVTSIKEFGAFVEILPGQEGLCHVSELSNDFIRAVTDVVRIGDEIKVKVIDIDDFGKIKLSKRAAEAGAEGGARAPRGERGERGDRAERGERGDRAERGERGDRAERGDRGDRERGERAERGDRGERDRGERGDRFAGRGEGRREPPSRGEREERGPGEPQVREPRPNRDEARRDESRRDEPRRDERREGRERGRGDADNGGRGDRGGYREHRREREEREPREPRDRFEPRGPREQVEREEPSRTDERESRHHGPRESWAEREPVPAISEELERPEELLGEASGAAPLSGGDRGRQKRGGRGRRRRSGGRE